MKRMPAVSAANVSAIWPASAQTFRAFLCWSNTRRFWRYEAKKRRPVPPRLLQTCLRRPCLFRLAGKDRGEKGRWVRLVHIAGAIQASTDFWLLRTHILTLRALWYAPPVAVQQICEQLRLNHRDKSALRLYFGEAIRIRRNLVVRCNI